ncbi:MAG: hypothetical protein P8M49_01175 [Thalassotalea sp.]|mgnify:CR=1 FL=1|nr:hypothetical protein [Thalassotalea sp.]MDG2392093.1 hypothetical protein [Thalassotalea sp.]
MKVQVKNFSTHQTAKVFAILMALTSLLFVIPFSLIPMLAPTQVAADGSEVNFGAFSIMFLLMPIFQGLFGYVVMRFGMWLYNKVTPRIGGIEFEFEEVDL